MTHSCKLCGYRWDFVCYFRCRCSTLKRARIQTRHTICNGLVDSVFSSTIRKTSAVVRELSCPSTIAAGQLDKSQAEKIHQFKVFWISEGEPGEKDASDDIQPDAIQHTFPKDKVVALKKRKSGAILRCFQLDKLDDNHATLWEGCGCWYYGFVRLPDID